MAKSLARELDDDDESPSGMKGYLSELYGRSLVVGKWCKGWSWKLAKKGGRWTWIIACSSIVMLLPLILEVDRETQVTEIEKMQIKDLRSKGMTDSQIVQQYGLTSLVDPTVGLASKN